MPKYLSISVNIHPNKLVLSVLKHDDVPGEVDRGVAHECKVFIEYSGRPLWCFSHLGLQKSIHHTSFNEITAYKVLYINVNVCV